MHKDFEGLFWAASAASNVGPPAGFDSHTGDAPCLDLERTLEMEAIGIRLAERVGCGTAADVTKVVAYTVVADTAGKARESLGIAGVGELGIHGQQDGQGQRLVAVSESRMEKAAVGAEGAAAGSHSGPLEATAS